MILNNFLYRVGQWARDNRARLLRLLFYILVALAVIFLIAGGVKQWQQWRYEKRVEAFEKQLRDAEAKAKAAETVINALKVEIAAKDALLVELDKQAGAAQKVVERTRTEYVYLKGEYEKTRDNPDVPADISNCGACAELARAGHACK